MSAKLSLSKPDKPSAPGELYDLLMARRNARHEVRVLEVEVESIDRRLGELAALLAKAKTKGDIDKYADEQRRASTKRQKTLERIVMAKMALDQVEDAILLKQMEREVASGR